MDRRNYAGAHSFAEESLSCYRDLDDRHGIATALRALGIAAHNEGDLDLARSACGQSTGIFRELGDRGCLILTLAALARQIHHQGDLSQAREIIQEARKILDGVGKELVATGVFDVFGRIALAQRDYAEAQRQFLDGLNFQRDVKDAHFVPSLLEGLAAVLAADARPQEAVHLLGAASTLRENAGLPRMQIEQAEYEQAVGRLKEQLGESGFERFWSAGHAMQADEVVSALQNGNLRSGVS